MIGDKGYICRATKENMFIKHGVRMVYPKKRNQTGVTPEDDKVLIRRRNIIENFWAWIQMYRHLKLRYDTKLESFKEFYYLGLIEVISKKKIMP